MGGAQKSSSVMASQCAGNGVRAGAQGHGHDSDFASTACILFPQLLSTTLWNFAFGLPVVHNQAGLSGSAMFLFMSDLLCPGRLCRSMCSRCAQPRHVLSRELALAHELALARSRFPPPLCPPPLSSTSLSSPCAIFSASGSVPGSVLSFPSHSSDED